jgi:hypothetical protein
MRKSGVIVLLCSVLLWVACSKKSDSGSDKELPVINLVSPLNNAIYTGGQTVNINAPISDNVRLAEIHVHISNNSSGQLLIDIHRYPDAATYNLNESFTAQAGINYKIQVLAIDKSANQKTETVFVTAN